mmetsp:Transcript_5940/g.11660  ORF Transcript_5940/g.11660 Transcript_5940/m.11660 type:complete len:178 (-) Transcript_5940:153-686(-)
MNFLKTYARDAPNRRCILTVHQPSSFTWEMIDHVILLSKGKVIYSGPRDQIERFFEENGAPTPTHWNPADFYLSVVNDEFKSLDMSVDEWADRFVAHLTIGQVESAGEDLEEETNTDDKNVAGQRNSSCLAILVELTLRYFLNLACNPGILCVRIGMYAMVSFYAGSLFWQVGERYD